MPDGCDHDQAYEFGDWWHEREERAGMRDDFPGRDTEPETDPTINILSGRTLDAVRAKQPEEAIRGGLAVRKITTALSSQGGIGKTTKVTQGAIEASLGLALFGFDDFAPAGKLRVLYINGEDSLPSVNYILGRMLPSYGLDRVPYDEFIISEGGSAFPMTATNARELSKRVVGEGYDWVITDPKVAFLPRDFRFLDPGAVRGFLQDGFGLLQRETDAALWLLDHDNKGGQALTGPADWSNFARLALHLERGEVDGQMKLTTLKANLGYRFKSLTFERDPATGRSSVVAVERFGDRPKHGSGGEDISQERLMKLYNARPPVPYRDGASCGRPNHPASIIEGSKSAVAERVREWKCKSCGAAAAKPTTDATRIARG
jgi:hypothetical protein